MELTGRLVTGAKQASLFTQLDWVMKQCVEKLGFIPYPGTLNLEIVADDLGLLPELKNEKGVELLPPDQNFCVATVWPIHIGGYEGAVVVPAKSVNIHNEKIVEIISGEKLRNVLNIEDGDLVTIRFEKPLVA